MSFFFFCYVGQNCGKKNEKQYNKTLIKILKDEKRCIEIKS